MVEKVVLLAKQTDIGSHPCLIYSHYNYGYTKYRKRKRKDVNEVLTNKNIFIVYVCNRMIFCPLKKNVDVFMTEHGTKCSTLIFKEDNCIRLEKQVQLYMNVLGRISIYYSVYQTQ